jgi:signal transduction histidine kinase
MLWPIPATAANRSPEPLDEIVRDVTELYEPSAEEADVRLALDETTPIIASVNRELIAQAVSNLIENALRHGRPVDTATDGTGRQAKVAITLRLENRQAIIAVSDNGPGVPADRLADIADRHVRLDDSRTSPGAGLGLSLVKAIAEAHGGKLEISNIHPGLRVCLRLPDAEMMKTELAANPE